LSSPFPLQILLEKIMNTRDTFAEGKAALDEVASTLHDGVSKADKAALQATRQSASAAKDILGKAESAANHAIDSAADAGKRVVDAAGEKWNQTSDALSQWGTAATDTVRKYPLASVAAVGVVGLILGSVLSSRR
jgi:ElaB/YqjD/DUF883 family membrane-anchored ribosome-binding protein